MTPIDSLVDSYLGAVAREAADLPPQRRAELLADLREHIATARAELETQTEAGVREILDRLGDPASIAAEARLGEPAPPGPPTVARVPPGRSRTGVWVAVVLATVGVVLLGCVAVAVFGLMAFRTAGSGGESGPVVQVDPPSPFPHGTVGSSPGR